jgi:hypothetical protein
MFRSHHALSEVGDGTVGWTAISSASISGWPRTFRAREHHRRIGVVREQPSFLDIGETGDRREIFSSMFPLRKTLVCPLVSMEAIDSRPKAKGGSPRIYAGEQGLQALRCERTINDCSLAPATRALRAVESPTTNPGDCATKILRQANEGFRRMNERGRSPCPLWD